MKVGRSRSAPAVVSSQPPKTASVSRVAMAGQGRTLDARDGPDPRNRGHAAVKSPALNRPSAKALSRARGTGAGADVAIPQDAALPS